MSPPGGVPYPVESRFLQRAVCLVHSGACSEGLLLAARQRNPDERIHITSAVVVPSWRLATHRHRPHTKSPPHQLKTYISEVVPFFCVAKALCSYGYAKRPQAGVLHKLHFTTKFTPTKLPNSNDGHGTPFHYFCLPCLLLLFMHACMHA